MPLSPFEEGQFQDWYDSLAAKLGLNPNPDDPQHFYDYRGAFSAGKGPSPDPTSGGALHWPSEFKREGHPRQFLDGIDTRTGEKMPLPFPQAPSGPLPTQPSPGGGAIPLQLLMALAARRAGGAPMARGTSPQLPGLPTPPASPGATPAVSEIGKPSLAEQLQLLQLLMKLGLWPQQNIPEHGGPFNIPAPDMPDLGFPRPDPNQTNPGQEFQGFYGPSPAEAPRPIPPPGQWPRPPASVPYPVGPLPRVQT